jgi:hypothetical protein
MVPSVVVRRASRFVGGLVSAGRRGPNRTTHKKQGKRAPPVLLSHLTAPHVVIASAIVASAGVPGLIKVSSVIGPTAPTIKPNGTKGTGAAHRRE